MSSRGLLIIHEKHSIPLFFPDYRETMPKIYGYNQWPSQWPPEFPCWTRYPIVMLKDGPWPYNWRVTRTLVGVDFPQPTPQYAVAQFKGVFLGDYTYDVFPSLLGPPTLTFVTIRLLGTLDEPTGIRYTMGVAGQVPDNYPNSTMVKEYERPYDYDRLYQRETFGGQLVHKDQLPHNDAFYEFAAPRYCGEQWPPR